MSTLTDFGIPGVQQGAILQPKLKNRWRVTFTQIGGLSSSLPLSMQVITTKRPKVIHQEIELFRYNSRAWIAGAHNWEELSMTVEDDVASTASNVIQQQLQLQQWLIGSDGTWLATAAEGSLYKFSTQLDMLDGGTNVLESWVMEGCWFTNADYGEVGYEENAKVTIELGMRFDNAYQTIYTYANAGYATGGSQSSAQST